MGVGAAIIGSAVIGAVGSGLAANQQAKAAKKAGRTELQMYYQTREDLAPYREVGTRALRRLESIFLGTPGTDAQREQLAALKAEREQLASWKPGPSMQPSSDDSAAGGGVARGTPDMAKSATGGPGDIGEDVGSSPDTQHGGADRWAPVQTVNPNAERIAALDAQIASLEGSLETGYPDYSEFYKSPGYQFRLAEGTKALDRSAAARGRLRSGAHERELIRYGQGVASGEFNNYANRLAALAGIGQVATGQTGQFGAGAASAAGQYQLASGTARASGYAGMANAANQGIQNYLFYYGLQNQGKGFT